MTYDLFAVAYHIGKVGYGHYYAICYNIITKKWYKFEDSIVSEVKLNEKQFLEQLINILNINNRKFTRKK